MVQRLFLTDDVIPARTLVERMNSISGRLYRDDATIFAWDLVNEPRCETWRVRSYNFHEWRLPLPHGCELATRASACLNPCWMLSIVALVFHSTAGLPVHCT